MLYYSSLGSTLPKISQLTLKCMIQTLMIFIIDITSTMQCKHVNTKYQKWFMVTYYMCTTHYDKTQSVYPSVAALFPWKFVELCPFLQLISPPFLSDPCLSGVGEHTAPLPSFGQWEGWLYYHCYYLMGQKCVIQVMLIKKIEGWKKHCNYG